MNNSPKKPIAKPKPQSTLTYQQITQILETEIRPQDYIDVQKGFTPEILKPEVLRDKAKDTSA